MARPDGFPAPLGAQLLYAERFVVACALAYRFAQRTEVAMAPLEGEIYLQRINCEYRDRLAERLKDCGATIARSYRSEQEDWIQTMIAAGMGICSLPGIHRLRTGARPASGRGARGAARGLSGHGRRPAVVLTRGCVHQGSTSIPVVARSSALTPLTRGAAHQS